MALVSMELSELDALRKRADDAEKLCAEQKAFNKQLNENFQKEVEEFKKGAKVLIKSPHIVSTVLRQDVGSIASRIYRDIQHLSPYLSQHDHITSIKSVIEQGLCKIGEERIITDDTYETIVDFEDVETEIKDMITARYVSEIEAYSKHIKTKKALEEDYQERLKTSFEIDQKANDAFRKHLEETKEAEIKKLKEMYEEKILHLSPMSKKLDDVLFQFGYKSSKNWIGSTILVPITK